MEKWLIFALLSAFFATGAMLIKKKVLKHEHSTEYLTVFKIMELVTVLILLPFISLSVFKISLNMLLFLYILSFFGTIALLLLAKSYRHLNLSIVAPLTNLSPALVVILAFFFLGERLESLQLTGIAFLVGGTYLLETRRKQSFRATIKKIFSTKHILLVFVALILIAFTAIGEKKIISGIHPFALLTYIYLFTAINSSIFLSLKYDGLKDIKHGIKKFGKLIFVDACFATATNMFYLTALGLASVSLVITINRTSTLFAVLLSGRAFHEKHLKRKTFACIIMLFGVFLVAL